MTRALAGEGYLADRGLATSVYLAATLEQPLLLEGEAGVGKTEVARALAAATGAELIRLQCHEGIDLHHAVYDWDYARQLLAIRAAEAGVDARELFGRGASCCAGRCCEALEHDGAGRAADRRGRPRRRRVRGLPARVPLGLPGHDPRARHDRRAAARPLVVLTSNRTRELHDALKRRCLYHWIDYPTPRARPRSCARGCPGCPTRSPCACAARSRGCATRSSTSCPAWGRRSPGRRR